MCKGGVVKKMCSPFFQLEVSDTGSTETYRDSVPTNYFRGCHGIVLVYDITNPASLYDLEDWMTDAYHKTGEDSTITYSLIGNKRDQMDSDLGLNDGKLFCTRHDISETGFHTGFFVGEGKKRSRKVTHANT